MLFIPKWKVPQSIKAICTTRIGGYSKPPYDSFNLATHVGDDLNAVENNRTLLKSTLNLNQSPYWLNQVHSNRIAKSSEYYANIKADALYANEKEHICLILTADCLPILLCDKKGLEVAAVHVGWRGLANNIIENTLTKFSCNNSQLTAWLGPCISQTYFSVDKNVYMQLIRNKYDEPAVVKAPKNKYHISLQMLASIRLQESGVNHISIDKRCTYENQDLFYSYRREQTTGRIASMIWLT